MLDTGISCYALYDNVIRAVADELDFFANPPGHSPTPGPADTAELIAELGDNQRVLGRLFELVAARTLINVLYPLDGACGEYMDDI